MITPARSPISIQALLASAFLTGAAGAQTLTVLVRDGDVISGVGTVTGIDDVEVGDSGTWLVRVDTDFATSPGDGVVLLDGVQLARETDALAAPPGTGISSFGAMQLDDAGRATWNLFLTGATTGTDSGIFRDGALVLQEGTNSLAPQYTGAAPYTGFFGAKNDGSTRLLVMASVDDPVPTGTANRAIVRWQLDGSGALLSETVVAKVGDMLGGVPIETVAELSTGRHEWACNRSGQVLYLADMTGTATVDGFLMLDGTLLVREGDPSPLAGRDWENLIDRAVDLNDAGEYVFRGGLTGATTDDEVVCKNGSQIIAQEGTSLPAIGGVFTFTGFGTGALAIDAAGDVFWLGDWNDPDTTRDVGLFRNGELLVQEGVTQVGGSTIESIVTVQDNFRVSRNGRYVVFDCKLTGGVDAAVRIDLGPANIVPFCFGDGTLTDHTTPCPCGNSGAPGHGCAHSFDAGGAELVASGTTVADDVLLTSSFEPATSFTLFMQHDAAGDVIFHDGTLCAGGTLIRLRGRAAVGGQALFPNPAFDSSITLSQRGSVTPGSGARRYYAAWYRNASTTFCPPATANVTNGVRIDW